MVNCQHVIAPRVFCRMSAAVPICAGENETINTTARRIAAKNKRTPREAGLFGLFA
jgi:hypothetical protein